MNFPYISCTRLQQSFIVYTGCVSKLGARGCWGHGPPPKARSFLVPGESRVFPKRWQNRKIKNQTPTNECINKWINKSMFLSSLSLKSKQETKQNNPVWEPLPGCVTGGQSPPLSKPPFFLLGNDSKARCQLAGQPRSQSWSCLRARNLFLCLWRLLKAGC